MVRRGKGKSTAILVDSSMSISSAILLPQLRALVEEKIGRVNVAKVVLLQEQAQKYAKEIAHNGFLPVIVHDDLDVHFALEAMELVYNEKIHILVIATENEKMLPLLVKAQEIGKEVNLVRISNASNNGLENAADHVFRLEIE
ncbi:MAG: NYN domain-containing protein [Promethearchaeota archaeon]